MSLNFVPFDDTYAQYLVENSERFSHLFYNGASKDSPPWYKEGLMIRKANSN